MPRIRPLSPSSPRPALPGGALTLFAVAVAVLPGCSAGINGPDLTISGVSPRIVCKGSTVTVTISGAGLSAVPVGALSGTAKVAVPRVTLRRVMDLKGEATMDMPVKIEDSPDTVEGSHVHTVSDTALAIDITPELNLEAGVYSVDVLSPSAPDIKTASIEKTLVVVAAPMVKTIDPGAACVGGSNKTVTLKGVGFIGKVPPENEASTLSVKMVPEAGGAEKIYEGNAQCQLFPEEVNPKLDLQLCTEVNWTIKLGDLSPGVATVELLNEAAGCPAATSMFEVKAPPKISAINRPPTFMSTVCGTNTRQILDITGEGFSMNPEVISNGMAAIAKYVSPTHITADFSKGTFTPGQVYDVSVANQDGCEAKSTGILAAVSGPEMLFIEPSKVWTSMVTPIVIQARALSVPLGMVQYAKSDIPEAMKMWRALTAMPDPAHDKRTLAVVPKNLALGEYDLLIDDGSGCATRMNKAFTVVDTGGPKLTSISRPNGLVMRSQAEVVTGTGFTQIPRLYLSPMGAAGTAIPVPAVTFQSATSLLATFPPVAAGMYDLIAVNPDSTVGFLAKAYTVGAVQPPRIDSVTPAVFDATIKIQFNINGVNFHDLAPKGIDVVLKCTDNAMRLAVVAKSSPTQLTVSATDFSMAPPGTTCSVRVTNSDDMGTVEFNGIAISGPGGAVVGAKAGPKTRAGHRAPAVGLVATAAAPHYLVAAGGDTGDLMNINLLDTVETLLVDGSGPQGNWVSQRNKLPAPTSLGGGAVLGRYFYFVGGNAGAGPVKTVLRALLLDPAGAPTISDVYIEPAVGAGLMGGVYSYRVAAKTDPADPDNPAGETVASDPWVITVPTLAAGAQVTVSWKKVPGALGYAIYRSPTGEGGSEQLVGTVADVATYTDMGGMPMPTTPLAPGAIGTWVKLADLGVARQGAAVAIAADPMKAGTWYLYAIGGSDGMKAIDSYEFLPITVAMDGAQTSPAQWTAGAQKLLKARAMAGAWVHSAGGKTYVYTGGGNDGANVVESSVEVGVVTANTGDLGTTTDAVGTLGIYGFAAVTAGNQLFTVGNQVPDTKVNVAAVSMPPVLPAFAAAGDALQARLLPGAAIDGPILFVVGGVVQNLVTNDTEWMVY